MNIKQKLLSNEICLSCEIFPPKAPDKIENFKKVIDELSVLSPAYISVTYGASGTHPQFTRELSQHVKNCGIPAISHLTCINSSKTKINEILDDLSKSDIKNVLALRGDIPKDASVDPVWDFKYASDLIKEIKKRSDFFVGAACYPEGNMEAKSREEDICHLKIKQDMGADFLISQMFFDNTVLYQFLYRSLQKGINIPVSAGIMPVVNRNQIKRITALSGASLPPQFLAILDRFGDNPESMEKAGIAYATAQIIDLIANGITNIHLYTMNRPAIAKAIFNNLGAIIRS